MADNTYITDKLAKIGKRIHKTALALFPELGVEGQAQGGGSQGGNRQDWLRQNNAIRNKDFVSLFSSIKLK